MDINTFLNHLDKVRNNGSNKWMACCPAHDDKSPSMAIKAGDDGRIILHCFAGCSTESIVSSLNLKMSDLFEKKFSVVKNKSRLPRHKLEAALMHDLIVLHIAINSRIQRYAIDPRDKDREKLAVDRIILLIKELYQ